MPGQSDAERVAQLQREAAADYGTPAERAQRAADARGQVADARVHGSQSSAADGRRC